MKETLYQALAQGFEILTTEDHLDWLKHCGDHKTVRELV